ncbi:MAG: hypothetical protein K6T80_07135 [Firmicutes bacterium]|nr:hypothetical protein [Bacillota bacterium]
MSVKGERRGDKINVLEITVLQKAEPDQEATAQEAPAEPAREAPAEEVFTVTVETDPKDGSKDFGDGIEPVTWVRAKLGGETIFVTARGDKREALKKVAKGEVTMKGTLVVDGSNKFLYIEELVDVPAA